jgi:hypothetical protein
MLFRQDISFLITGAMEIVTEKYACSVPDLEPETDWGRVEYKRQLANLTPFRRTQLITQMKWRLREGKGVAEYNIGVDDDGKPYPLNEKLYNESLTNLLSIANEAGATVRRLVTRECPDGRVISATLNIQDSDMDEYRWMVIGTSQVGKTTIIGCMVDGMVDDCHGYVRNRKLRHMHEIDTGGNTQPLYSHLVVDDAMLLLVDFPGSGGYFDDTVSRIMAFRPTGIIHVVPSGDCDNTELAVQFTSLAAALSETGLPVIRASVQRGDVTAAPGDTTILCNTLQHGGCSELLARIMQISKSLRESAWGGYDAGIDLTVKREASTDPVLVTVCDVMESFDLGLVVYGVVVRGALHVGTELRMLGTYTGAVFVVESLHRYRRPVCSVSEDTIASFAVTVKHTSCDTSGSVQSISHDNQQTMYRALRRGCLLASREYSRNCYIETPNRPMFSASGFCTRSYIMPCLMRNSEGALSVWSPPKLNFRSFEEMIAHTHTPSQSTDEQQSESSRNCTANK